MRLERGARCGVSSRSISACRRSASLMITCVYSRSSARSSSRSSSCAEPRRPPSGFLISCARLRISSRFACCSIRGAPRARCAAAARSGAARRAAPRPKASMRRDGAGQRHRLAAGAHVGHVARRVVPVDDARLVERALELVALGEEAEERLADEAARSGGEQVLGGGVGVAHHELVVEHDDRGGEQVEAGESGRGHLVARHLRGPAALQRLRLASSRFSASMFFSWLSTLVLERLQTLCDARVVALVAAAHRLLLGQRLPRLVEQLLPRLASSCSRISRWRSLRGARARRVDSRGKFEGAGVAPPSAPALTLIWRATSSHFMPSVVLRWSFVYVAAAVARRRT